MRIFRSLSLIILIGIATVGLTGASAKAATLTTSGGQLTGATDLVVAGVGTFNVIFADGTCAALFSGCDDATLDFDFQTATNARAAGLALLALIDGSVFDADPGATVGCIGLIAECSTIIPYAVPSVGTLLFALLVNFDEDVASGIDEVNFNETSSSFDFGTLVSINFARFTPVGVIPLPAALPLYGTGLAVMGFLGWRRKRKALRD